MPTRSRRFPVLLLPVLFLAATPALAQVLVDTGYYAGDTWHSEAPIAYHTNVRVILPSEYWYLNGPVTPTEVAGHANQTLSALEFRQDTHKPPGDDRKWIIADMLFPGRHNGPWSIAVDAVKYYPYPPEYDSATIERTVRNITVRDVEAQPGPIDHGYVVMYDPDDPDLDTIRVQYTLDWWRPGQPTFDVRVLASIDSLDPDGTLPGNAITSAHQEITTPGQSTHTIEWDPDDPDTPEPELERGIYAFSLTAMDTWEEHDLAPRNSPRTSFENPGAYIRGPVGESHDESVRGDADAHEYTLRVHYKITDNMGTSASDVDVKAFGASSPDGHLDRLADQQACPTGPLDTQLEVEFTQVRLDGHVKPAGSYSEDNKYENERYWYPVVGVDDHDINCHKAHLDKPIKAVGKDYLSPVRVIEFGYMVHETENGNTCNHLDHFESVDTLDKIREAYGDAFIDIHFIEPHDQIAEADCHKCIGDLYEEEGKPRWKAFWSKYDDRTSRDEEQEGMSVYLLAARHWKQEEGKDYYGLCFVNDGRAPVFVDRIREAPPEPPLGNSHLPHTAVHEVGHYGWGRRIYHCENPNCVMISGEAPGGHHDGHLFADGCHRVNCTDVNHLDEMKLRIHCGPDLDDPKDDFPMWGGLFESDPQCDEE